MGLRLVLQPRPLCPALYAISVRRLGTLPAASFRFHLAMDTLAVRLTLPTTKRVVDFHHQAIAHGGRTKGRVAKRKNRSAPSFYAVWCRHGSKKRPDCGKPHGSGALKLALSCFRNAGCGYYSIFLLMPSPKQTDVF